MVSLALRSYTKHSPNTVMPVSFTSIAQVPRNKSSIGKKEEAMGGKHSPTQHWPTLLKNKAEILLL